MHRLPFHKIGLDSSSTGDFFPRSLPQARHLENSLRNNAKLRFPNYFKTGQALELLCVAKHKLLWPLAEFCCRDPSHGRAFISMGIAVFGKAWSPT